MVTGEQQIRTFYTNLDMIHGCKVKTKYIFPTLKQCSNKKFVKDTFHKSGITDIFNLKKFCSRNMPSFARQPQYHKCPGVEIMSIKKYHRKYPK